MASYIKIDIREDSSKKATRLPPLPLGLINFFIKLSFLTRRLWIDKSLENGVPDIFKELDRREVWHILAEIKKELKSQPGFELVNMSNSEGLNISIRFI